MQQKDSCNFNTLIALLKMIRSECSRKAISVPHGPAASLSNMYVGILAGWLEWNLGESSRFAARISEQVSRFLRSSLTLESWRAMWTDRIYETGTLWLKQRFELDLIARSPCLHADALSVNERDDIRFPDDAQ